MPFSIYQIGFRHISAIQTNSTDTYQSRDPISRCNRQVLSHAIDIYLFVSISIYAIDWRMYLPTTHSSLIYLLLYVSNTIDRKCDNCNIQYLRQQNYHWNCFQIQCGTGMIHFKWHRPASFCILMWLLSLSEQPAIKGNATQSSLWLPFFYYTEYFPIFDILTEPSISNINVRHSR